MNPTVVIGTVLVLLAAIPANLILYLYRNIPWQDSNLGKVMFTKAFSIALVLDFSVVAGIFLALDLGRPGWLNAVRLVVFSSVVVALWWQYHMYKTILREEGLQDDVSGHSLTDG